VQRARDELAKEVLLLEKRCLDAEDSLEKAQEERKSGVPSSSRGTRSLNEGPHSDAKALQRDVELLLRELDRERTVNAELAEAVNTSRAEAARAAERFVAAEKEIRALKKPPASVSASQPPSSSLRNSTQEQLLERISALKSARDRLIESLDTQTEELQRLNAENMALAGSVIEYKGLAASWEAQAQQNVSRCNYLKDLLEESAAWDTTDIRTSSRDGIAGEEVSTRDRSDSDELWDRCRRLERDLLQQLARSADLESQVNALCAELTRLAAAASGTHRAVLPVLCSVEARLESLVKVSKRQPSSFSQ